MEAVQAARPGMTCVLPWILQISTSILSGGQATMISGITISILPTTIVQSGGYLHAYITQSGSYCSSLGPVQPNPGSIPFAMQDSTLEDFFLSFGHDPETLLTIYPNPTKGSFILEINPEFLSALVVLEIYGMNGERIVKATLPYGSRKYECSLEGKPSGIYVIRIISGEKSLTRKIIKE
jgi:hypothetical protein